jgi:hypothetical protein
MLFQQRHIILVNNKRITCSFFMQCKIKAGINPGINDT